MVFSVLSVLPVPFVHYCKFGILLSLIISASSSCYRMGENVKRAPARVKQVWEDMSVSQWQLKFLGDQWTLNELVLYTHSISLVYFVDVLPKPFCASKVIWVLFPPQSQTHSDNGVLLSLIWMHSPSLFSRSSCLQVNALIQRVSRSVLPGGCVLFHDCYAQPV